MKATIALVLACLTLLTAQPCQARAHHRVKRKQTLYHRLGGRNGISAVVNDFVAAVANDTRISFFFAGIASDEKALGDFKQKLIDQICQAAGGPCKYKGRNMRQAHAGLHIRSEHFDALVEDLVASLDKFGVKPKDKSALLAKLGPMKKDIVEKAPQRSTASGGN